MDRRTLLFVFSLTLSFLLIRAGFNYYDQKQLEEYKKTHPQTKIEEKKSAIPVAKTENKTPALQVTPTTSSQKFYVLQNDTLQLVFSNIGGAISEINLPFQNANKSSVVLPIAFDRMIAVQAPFIDKFPLQEALSFDGKLVKQTLGGYYPLLRRGNGKEPVSPEYDACAIVSEYPEVARQTYEVKKFTKNEIVFEGIQYSRKIIKRFFLPENSQSFPYTFQLEIKIEGEKEGLFLTSGVPEIEWISGAQSPSIKYHLVRGKSASCEKVDIPKDTFTMTSVQPDWISNSNGFFGIILDPIKGTEAGFKVTKIPGPKALSRLFFLDRSSNRFPVDDLYGCLVAVPLAKEQSSSSFRIFAGPLSDEILKKVDTAYAQEEGGRTSDYALSQTFHGWFAFISEPFARFLFWIMNFFHYLFGSWALSIVLISIVLRILMYPLNAWSMNSMRKMQLLSPQLKAIQERNKKDPQKSQVEIMELYKTHGVNPLTGCLPMLIQMPFLIGMFDLLKSAFPLRGATFIPGWINDLSAPDVLFSWDFSIPFIGNEFHLLPVILGAIMFIQQQTMTEMPKNPAEWTDQQRQQRAASNIMTVVFTVMFYHFPAGLNIYWISSTLLGIVQQLWTNKMVKIEKVVTTKKKF